ncbi:hypothetical protein BHU72_13625 [Desulfuribacillus stibiiarsenatis]|uniref:DUF3298 domain-containing protein n=1 Tax=Desulfuribacillus stibiiarsenatis TaxID=1390249 RepID=A0A1E5L934_9FIRM|nr:WG repeat-containing protein [Desulfuribacillus stibiiarsenatis]OEH86453.1 hypothetical protein BHU72_13625 [Desulfuribacillus stibiiarsenatis]
MFEKYVSLVQMFLPNGGQLIYANQQPAIQLADVDGDGYAEVVAGYRLQNEMYIIVLKCTFPQWRVIANVKGKGYAISYLGSAPISNCNACNIIIGWQMGTNWSELAIYEWKNHRLQNTLTTPVIFSCLDIVRKQVSCGDVDRIALWMHDTGEAYLVDVYQWSDGKLVLATNGVQHYYKGLVDYYQNLVKEMPDSQVYWYYLAESQYRAGMGGQALASIERVLQFDSPYPSEETAKDLKRRILSKEPIDCAQEEAMEEMCEVNDRAIQGYAVSVKTTAGQKWGYINTEGNYIIEPRYEYAMDFQCNGLAVVQVDNLNGLIDETGNFVVEPKYSMISEFAEQRAVVSDHQGYKVIDETGKVYTSESYDYIDNFSEDRAVFTAKNGDGDFRNGYLNREGQVVIQPQFMTAYSFKNGKTVVQKSENEFALIGRNGELYQTYPFAFVGPIGDGMMGYKATMDGKYGYIDEKGTIIIEPRFSGALPFENGRAIVNASDNYTNRYGLIDKTGKFIVQPEYNDIIELGEGRLALGKAIDAEAPYQGSVYAIATVDGKLLTEFQYYNVLDYKMGVASVNDGHKTFFIKTDGTIAEDLPIIDGCGSLVLMECGNLIKVIMDMRVYFINRAGELVWKENNIIPLTPPYRVIEKKYKPNKDYLVYYPQVEGVQKPAVQSKINKRLQELSQIKPIKPDVKLDYNYTGDFAVEFFRKDLLVLELNGYEYPFGAAHGMPNKTYANIDLKTGAFYRLGDLFKANSDYVKVLSDIVEEQIKNDPEYSYVFPGTYKGIFTNHPFYIDLKALYVYFAPYEIAPYAAGFPTFRIPFTEIDTIINKKGDFWRSFHFPKKPNTNES